MSKQKTSAPTVPHIESLLERAWDLSTDDPVSAYALAQDASCRSQEIAYSAGISAGRLVMGRCEALQDHYYEAMSLAEESHQIFAVSGEYKWQARSCRVLAYIHIMLGRYDKALGLLLSGKKLMEDHAIPLDASFLNNIAAIFSNIDKYREAIEFYLQALELARPAKDRILALLYSNLSEAYLALGNPGEALNYNYRALDELSERENFSALCHCHNCFGRIYAETGSLDKAHVHLETALAAAREHGLVSFEIETSMELSRLYNRQGKYDDSLGILSGVLYEAKKIQAGELQKRVLLLLAQTHEANGSAGEALSYYKEYMKMEKEIASKDLEMELNMYAQERKVEQAHQDAQLYRRKNAELTQKTLELEHLSRTDSLTGLFNRRYTQFLIDSENARCAESPGVYCIVLGDVDHFKSINDTYGHDCGDCVLRTLAAHMKSALRKDDCLSRWGGDEFLLLLPGTSLESAVTISEKLRTGLQGMEFDYFGNRINVSMTFGIAQYFNDPNADSVIIRADRALYQGKNAGRNCVSAL